MLSTAVDGLRGVAVALCVCAGRRQTVRRLTGLRATGTEDRVLGLFGHSVRRDAGEHAAEHLLGMLDLFLDQTGEQGPVIGLELLLCDPTPELLEFLQGDIEAFLRVVSAGMGLVTGSGICARSLRLRVR